MRRLYYLIDAICFICFKAIDLHTYDYAQESPVCSRGVRSATIYNVSQYLI